MNIFEKTYLSIINESKDDKPLTFTAKKSNSTINLITDSSPVIDGLQYRLNENDDWQRYELGTEIELKNVGDYVQFQNTNTELSTGYDDFVYFEMTGKIAGSGNIQSMLNYSTSCTPYCYFCMFRDCTSLTETPELSAINLANHSYADMFNGCINLTNAPELPATILAKSCYESMFAHCKNLIKAPALPATILANGCYYGMFYDCISLTEAPELPAGELADYCYDHMFDGCTSLNNNPLED